MKEKTFEKIQVAKRDKIKNYEEFSRDFLYKIFNLQDTLLTDESSIYDFDFQFDSTTKKIDHATNKILKKIEKEYGIDVSDVIGLNLVNIFRRIKMFSGM